MVMMRNGFKVLGSMILAGLLLGSGGYAFADPIDVKEQLTSGGRILMIRHALAPGSGDPSNFELGDCKTQRNLDDAGREQARRIGDWLREEGVKSARIYASQWCRCLETASLLNLGPVQELPALNSFFERPEDREPNITALKDFVAQQPLDGELIILVTHFVTIAAISGQGVSSGQGVLLALEKDRIYKVVGDVHFGQAGN